MLHSVLSQAACGLAFFIAAVAPASAGSFAVSPVRTTLSAGQSVGSLTVRNEGPEPTVVQLESVSWSQQDGKDVYAPTREILATPPIFTIPPGGSQVVRIGMRRAPDAQRELTYRLFMQEVPPPPKPGVQGLQVALRLGVPVFILPSIAVAPVLQWQVARTPEGRTRLSVSNHGNAHVQVSSFKLAASGGRAIAAMSVSAYVLPGQSREWVTNAVAPAGTSVRVSAQTDGGVFQADVVVAKP
jgi:fimbrial chaperone protein